MVSTTNWWDRAMNATPILLGELDALSFREKV